MTTQQESKTSTLHVMDGNGDSRFMWNPDSAVEVEAARAQFDALKKKGYWAYTTDEEGGQGEVIHEFDPRAGAIIMAPQLVGG